MREPSILAAAGQTDHLMPEAAAGTAVRLPVPGLDESYIVGLYTRAVQRKFDTTEAPELPRPPAQPAA